MDKEKEMCKPLTIEELKVLQVGDWVWIVDPTSNNSGTYWIKYEYLLFNPMNEYFKDLVVVEDYGKYWVAYKNKEEAKNTGYGNVRQAVREFAEKLKEKATETDDWTLGTIITVDLEDIDETYKELYGED